MTHRKLLTLFIVIILALLAFGVNAKIASDYSFVKGKYGHKCYAVGSEHGNIEYKVYFKTLEECLNSLK